MVHPSQYSVVVTAAVEDSTGCGDPPPLMSCTASTASLHSSEGERWRSEDEEVQELCQSPYAHYDGANPIVQRLLLERVGSAANTPSSMESPRGPSSYAAETSEELCMGEEDDDDESPFSGGSTTSSDGEKMDGGDVRPKISYPAMLTMALRSMPDKRGTLSQIYAFIQEKFPYYRQGTKWQNSVRHNLSLNACFQKVDREANVPGKGSYWTIVPKYDGEMFQTQNYSERRKVRVKKIPLRPRRPGRVITITSPSTAAALLQQPASPASLSKVRHDVIACIKACGSPQNPLTPPFSPGCCGRQSGGSDAPSRPASTTSSLATMTSSSSSPAATVFRFPTTSAQAFAVPAAAALQSNGAAPFSMARILQTTMSSSGSFNTPATMASQPIAYYQIVNPAAHGTHWPIAPTTTMFAYAPRMVSAMPARAPAALNFLQPGPVHINPAMAATTTVISPLVPVTH